MRIETGTSDVTLIHGDCLDVLSTLEAGSVDSVITDPPYNLGVLYSAYVDDRPDYEEWCSGWLSLLRRSCSGPIAITCGHKNLSMWHRILEPTWVICWWKPAAMGRCVVGFNNWEPIILYGNPHVGNAADVIRAPIKIRTDTGDHPCPKPLGWATELIKILTKPGMTVLDPFAGSGTTGVACMKTGRRAILIESALKYIPLIQRRLQAAETPLFAGLEEGH